MRGEIRRRYSPRYVRDAVGDSVGGCTWKDSVEDGTKMTLGKNVREERAPASAEPRLWCSRKYFPRRVPAPSSSRDPISNCHPPCVRGRLFERETYPARRDKDRDRRGDPPSPSRCPRSTTREQNRTWNDDPAAIGLSSMLEIDWSDYNDKLIACACKRWDFSGTKPNILDLL